ncbi:MAG: type IV pilus assembly protein PilM [Candidatus Omnitrophota bacterium]
MKPLLEKLKGKFAKDIVSVGLDIGTSQIKLVKMKFTKDVVELCDFCVVDVLPDLSGALELVAKHQELKIVNISFCGPSTTIRYINSPKMSHDELRKSLKFEAQKYIPFSVAEVNLDAAILKSDLPDNKMLVAIAAVKKDFLNQRIKLFETSGFKIGVVDIDSLSLINAFNFNFSKNTATHPKTVSLLNIGSTFSSLNILDDGMPVLSRDIDIAGNGFTKKIAETLSLDFKNAEELKVNPDQDRISKVTKAVESTMSALASEIRVSFDYYESQSASVVSKIFVSGGGSLFPGLKDSLKVLLGIEVDYWDPLGQIGIAGHIDSEKLKQISSQLAVAVGLSLRP